jgi:hypothetical protein
MSMIDRFFRWLYVDGSRAFPHGLMLGPEPPADHVGNGCGDFGLERYLPQFNFAEPGGPCARHDWAYETRQGTRAQADDVFHRNLLTVVEKTWRPWWRWRGRRLAHLAYRVVRLLGDRSWPEG